MARTDKTSSNSGSQVINLDYSERDRHVQIIPEDNDKFVVTVEHAIEACRLYAPEERARVRQAYDELLQTLGEWTLKHHKDIKHAFFTLRDGGFLFLLVTQDAKYDGSFQDELSELDIRIAHDQRYERFDVDCLAIPNCTADGYESFLHPDVRLALKPGGGLQK